MTPAPKVIAAIGVVLVAASFATGRLTAPKCATIEVDRSRDSTMLAEKKAAGVEIQQTATAAASDHQETRTVIRYVRRPDGTEATTTTKVETHDQATATTLATARRTWEAEERTRAELVEREHVRQVAAARPDWSVLVVAGASVAERERFIGAAATRRVLGPFELGMFASTRGDVGAALAVRW